MNCKVCIGTVHCALAAQCRSSVAKWLRPNASVTWLWLWMHGFPVMTLLWTSAKVYAFSINKCSRRARVAAYDSYHWHHKGLHQRIVLQNMQAGPFQAPVLHSAVLLLCLCPEPAKHTSSVAESTSQRDKQPKFFCKMQKWKFQSVKSTTLD